MWCLQCIIEQAVSFLLMAVKASVEMISLRVCVRACVCARVCVSLSVFAYPFISGNSPVLAFPSDQALLLFMSGWANQSPRLCVSYCCDTVGQRRCHGVTSHPHGGGDVSWLFAPTRRGLILTAMWRVFHWFCSICEMCEVVSLTQG